MRRMLPVVGIGLVAVMTLACLVAGALMIAHGVRESTRKRTAPKVMEPVRKGCLPGLPPLASSTPTVLSA